MSEGQKLSVGGFVFYTEKDARIAESELKKIEYLEARIDYSRPESILRIFEKTLHERIFKTPVGLQYLKSLRDFLIAQPEINPEEVPDIPLYGNYGGELRSRSNPARNRISPAKEKRDKDKSRFTISVILNILLVVAIIAMFVITIKSDNPNALNYERAVIDKYATWEQELTEREQIIREKEKELQK